MKTQIGRMLAVASSFSIATGGIASAADIAVKASPIVPPAAIYSWSGWYAGVNGGWAFDNNATGRLVSADPLFNDVLAAGGTPTFFGASHRGGFGGAQVGYNWQMTHWLVGLEADIQDADIGHTSALAFSGDKTFAPSVSTARDHIDWFGTLRGRVGLTAGPALFYATGGLAYGSVTTDITNDFRPVAAGNFRGSDSGARAGWVAGAGAEWAFAAKWVLRGEYLHMDLGRSNVTMAFPAAPGLTATYGFSHVVDAVRVGVSYRFAPVAMAARY